MKLGSLFSGSGGFELAGAINGIEPVWASEIEPYPIRVTKARFPQMKHLGSVLDVNGAEIEHVDIITFGSPCQDLSVAGKQAGLHKGERSNLFFEAIRIIKEMRGATDGRHPRIAVWENVPGAYSSNKGEDFRAVLEAFVRLREQAADVPMPKGSKWAVAGCVVGNGYSIAWRTLDAQYNGVPQRRKRIYLIADFGSERAGEVLFEQNRVRRDTAPGGTAGEGTSGNVEGSAGRGGVCYSLDRASFNQGINAQYKPQIEEELASALVARGPSAVCYPVENHPNDSRMNLCEDGVVPTLSSRMGTGGNNGPMVLETAKPPRKYIIRRLTPLECVRLQGLPDAWLDGVDGSDSAKYKMLGNGIAMPNAIYVIGCAKKLIEGV